MNKVLSFSIDSYKWATALFLFVIVLGSIIGILTPAGLGWDFANFYDTGRRVAAGQQADIYHPDRLIQGETPQGDLAFWGTPLSAWLYAPLSGFSPPTALMLFKIQNTVAYFLSLGLLFQLNRQWVEHSPLSQWRFAAQFFGMCLLFQPLWTVYRVGGQTTPTVLFLLSLGLLFYTNGRQWLTAWCLVMAAMIKPAFILGVALLMLISGLRFFLITSSVFAILGIVSLGVMGFELHMEFIARMLNGAKITYPWMFNSSLYVLIEHLRLFNHGMSDPLVPNQVFSWFFSLVKVSVLGVFGFLLVRGYSVITQGKASRHFTYLLACTFALMLAQTVWEHYLAVLILLLGYLLTIYDEMPSGAKGVFLSIIGFSVGQNLIFIHLVERVFEFSSLISVVLICLFKSLPLFLTLLYLLIFHNSLLRSYARERWRDERSVINFFSLKGPRAERRLADMSPV